MPKPLETHIVKQTTGMGTHYYAICPNCNKYLLVHSKSSGILCGGCHRMILFVETTDDNQIGEKGDEAPDTNN